jgi:glycosyltransferase involved in cell wall biosynthesis
MRAAITADGRRIREVIVVVPARDEERLIGRCLESILVARARLAASDPDVSVRITVVADACRDDTEAIARGYADDGVELVSIAAGRVGIARAAGIDGMLASRVAPDAAAVWIANTDADSTVPPGWLTDQVRFASQGADLVVGTVRPDPADLTAEQNDIWLRSHVRGRPNGHVHGANLGIRASAYDDAGGFDPVGEHEDNLLVARLRAAGAAVVASDEVEVHTSGRRAGRTPGGYAAYLARSLGASVHDAEEADHDEFDSSGRMPEPTS